MRARLQIRENDITFYLLFAVVIIFFQLSADMFIHNIEELFHGWKVYDYLVYTRYRFLQVCAWRCAFPRAAVCIRVRAARMAIYIRVCGRVRIRMIAARLQRETRWKGMEVSLDECIEEGMRTLDQMCFSSQYYLMLSIAAAGIVLFVLGIEIMMRQAYNFFGDPALIFLIIYTLAVVYVIMHGYYAMADYLGVWRIKHANTAWHSALGDEGDGEFGVPGWDELGKEKGASHEEFIMNQRITSETFRHKFLDYNRAWIVAQLPSILTPRTLRRSRPYLIAQFTKLLGSVNPDVSEDSSDDEEETRDFGPVALSNPSRVLIRLWLANARRQRRFREVVQGIILKNKKDECEQCLSRRQLQVGRGRHARWPRVDVYVARRWSSSFP